MAFSGFHGCPPYTIVWENGRQYTVPSNQPPTTMEDIENDEIYTTICRYRGRYLTDTELWHHLTDNGAVVSMATIRNALRKYESVCCKPGFLGFTEKSHNGENILVYKAPPWFVCKIRLCHLGQSIAEYTRAFYKKGIKRDTRVSLDLHLELKERYPKCFYIMDTAPFPTLKDKDSSTKWPSDVSVSGDAYA